MSENIKSKWYAAFDNSWVLKPFEFERRPVWDNDILIDISNQNEIILKKRAGSTLNFQKLIDKANGLTNWLAVKVCHSVNELKIEILEI